MQEDIEPPEELVADVLGAWQIHQIFDEGSGESTEKAWRVTSAVAASETNFKEEES